MTCEFSQAYVSYLIARVDTELSGCYPKDRLSRANTLLDCTKICQSINKITSEDAKKIKERVIAICPQLQKDP